MVLMGKSGKWVARWAAALAEMRVFSFQQVSVEAKVIRSLDNQTGKVTFRAKLNFMESVLYEVASFYLLFFLF